MKNMAKNLLRKALSDQTAEFREGQWGCIEALLRKRRMLVVQRTGWGKSMVYFLATRMLRDAGEGFALLISPLLSLMRNQILAAERIGIRAETINSTNPDDWDAVREKLRRNEIDILLISPERLANNDFREDMLKWKIVKGWKNCCCPTGSRRWWQRWPWAWVSTSRIWGLSSTSSGPDRWFTITSRWAGQAGPWTRRTGFC